MRQGLQQAYQTIVPRQQFPDNEIDSNAFFLREAQFLQQLNTDKVQEKNKDDQPQISSYKQQKNNHKSAEKRILALHQFASQYYQAVGVLRADWLNSKGEISIINYGTAFAIGPQVLISCQHNIFHQNTHKATNQIFFIPGIDGKVGQSTKIYKSAKNNYFKVKQIIRLQETFTKKPIAKELCVIVLQQPLNLKNYIKIGSMQLQSKQKLQIIGYGSRLYSKKLNLLQIIARRSHLKGDLINVSDVVVSHNMKTQSGLSGSAILTKNKKNQVVAIGIHTHRGCRSGVNNGLLFTEQILRRMLEYIHSLALQNNLTSPQLTLSKDDTMARMGCTFTNHQIQSAFKLIHHPKNVNMANSKLEVIKQSSFTSMNQITILNQENSQISLQVHEQPITLLSDYDHEQSDEFQSFYQSYLNNLTDIKRQV